MGKKFTTKKHRLRARSRRRVHALKTNPQTTGLKETLEQQNYDVIKSIEAKMMAEA